MIDFFPVNNWEDFGEEKEEHKSLFHTRNNQNLQNAGKRIRQLALTHGCAFINLNDGLTDQSDNLKKELTFDGMHMVTAGYEIVLHNMMPYLQD